MLQTETTWEIPEETRLVRALTGDQTKRRYHLFELALNLPIYRLDVVMPFADNGKPGLRRFRFGNLQSALEFIAHESPLQMNLVQEPAYEIGKKPELREIYEVSSAIDGDGLEVLVIDTDKGMFCIGGVTEDPDQILSNIQRLWVCAAQDGRMLLRVGHGPINRIIG